MGAELARQDTSRRSRTAGELAGSESTTPSTSPRASRSRPSASSSPVSASWSPALRIASERIGGPLGDELRLTIQEQSLGLSTLDSLQNWMGRCAAPSVQTFVRAMVQGERLGISIGQILRNLAVEMRKRKKISMYMRSKGRQPRLS